MRRFPTAVTVVFYASLVLVIAAVLTEALPLLLPDAVAVRVAHNSEGLVLALLLASWIQFTRPRLTGVRHQWAVTAAVAFGCVVVGVALLLTDLPSRFRTLNETFLAAAVVIPYLQLRRPLPRRLAPALAGLVLLAVVALNRTDAVTSLAETLGVLLLVPLAFDVVDRGILDPAAPWSARRSWSWYALLVAAPVAFSVLQYGIGVPGLAGEAVRYAVRITEAFACLLLVEVFFTVGLGRTGSRRLPGVPHLVTAR